MSDTELTLCRGLWDGKSQTEMAKKMGLHKNLVQYLIRQMKAKKCPFKSTIYLMRLLVKEGVLEP